MQTDRQPQTKHQCPKHCLASHPDPTAGLPYMQSCMWFDQGNDKMNVSSKNNEQEFICFEANQSISNCETVGSAIVVNCLE